VRRLIEIVTQAGDCPGIIGRPAVGEAARGGTSPRQGSGIHDGVQVGPDGWLVGIPDLGEDIADLVRPAALYRHAGVGGRHGGEQARTAIDADHLELICDRAAADEVAEEAFPLGRALARDQAEVDDLLPIIGTQAESNQHRPAARAVGTPGLDPWGQVLADCSPIAS
jgi:hypothetical protein